MKFLGWLFNASSRHRLGIRMYEKGKVGIRLITLLVSLAIVAVAFLIEYWFFSSLMTKDSFGGGSDKVLTLLGIGILMVVLFLAALEYCAIYGLTAFKMAIYGTALTLAKRAEIKKAKKKAKEEGVEYVPDENIQKMESEKTYKALDIIIGIFEIILVIGIIIGFFILMYNMLIDPSPEENLGSF